MEWKQRYTILNPNAVPKSGFIDPKKACEKILATLPFDVAVYRFGHTKLFFKAGIIGALEDLRDDKIAQILTVEAHTLTKFKICIHQCCIKCKCGIKTGCIKTKENRIKY